MGAWAEVVVGDHGRVGLTTELTVFRRVGELVEPGTNDFRRVFEVLEQLVFADVQQFDLVAFAEVGAVDHKLQATPCRFELLHILVVQDLIDLAAELAIDFGDHLVDSNLVGLFVGALRRKHLADERFDAALGDSIAFIIGG